MTGVCKGRGDGVVHYFSQLRSGATTKLNTISRGYYLIFRYLKPIFQPPLLIIIAQSLTFGAYGRKFSFSVRSVTFTY